MKTVFCKWFLGVSIFFIAIKSSAQIHYNIKGIVKNNTDPNGIKDGDTFVLDFGNKNTIKKTILKNGQFEFKGDILEPSVGFVRFTGNGIKLLVDSSNYLIDIDEVEFVENQKKYRTYDFNINTNSSFHNLWKNFYDNYLVQAKQKRELLDKLNNVKNVDSMALYNTSIVMLTKDINASFKKAALQNPNNYAIAYLLPDAPDFSYNNYFAVYEMLSEEIKKSELGLKLYKRLISIKQLKDVETSVINTTPTKIAGKVIIPISVIDTLGNNYIIKPDALKSSYTLIDFWASWCAPCRLKNIDLLAKVEEYKKLGIKIIGFSLDQDLVKWKNAVSIDKTKWQQVSDLKATNSPWINFFQISKIPYNVLLDAKGVVIGEDISDAEIKDLIKAK